LKKFAIFGVACLMGLYANTAAAQPPGGGGRGGFGMGGMGGFGANPTMLLNNQSVQAELKLSPQEVADILKKYNEESVALLAKVLAEKAKPETVTRFNQIRTQTLGFAAFQDSSVVKALKLTDDQVKEIKEIADDQRKEFEELRQGGGGPEMFTKMQEIQKASLTKAVAVLKDEQKKSWEEMKGKTFTMQGFGGGGGAGRPRRDQ